VSGARNVVADHRMVEIGTVVPNLAGHRVAAEVFLPASGPHRSIAFCCLPGGAMSYRYWDLRPAGDDTYSFALWMAGAGFPVICVDHLGTGGSVLPLDAPAPLLEEVVAANDAAFRTLLDELDGHDPACQRRSVGVGHSMGAAMTVRQQATYGTYDAVALLGFGFDGLPAALSPTALAVCADGIPDDERLAELALGMFGSAYPGRSREPTTGAALDSGSSAAVKQELAAARTVLLGAGGLLSMLPGNVAADAERLRVPVLVMNGERDSLIEGRRAQARQYRQAASFAARVLPDMGHNQNVAPTRHQLWEGLRRWAESALAG
jgi:alpha-beta hydrolase superfamily lysophospholipase